MNTIRWNTTNTTDSSDIYDSFVWSGLIGIVIFGIALYHIIGWSIAPNASAFMWIINQIGGGQ